MERLIAVAPKRSEPARIDRAVLDHLRHHSDVPGTDLTGEYTNALTELCKLRETCFEKPLEANDYNLRAVLRCMHILSFLLIRSDIMDNFFL